MVVMAPMVTPRWVSVTRGMDGQGKSGKGKKLQLSFHFPSVTTRAPGKDDNDGDEKCQWLM